MPTTNQNPAVHGGSVKNSDTSQNSLAARRAYTIAEAAQLLGCHKASVYRRLYAGEIKVLKGFGQLRIPASEIDRFLNRVTEYTPRRKRGYAARQAKKESAVAGAQT